VNAIKKLCGPEAHVNIVQVLGHGQLSNIPYYFIDMEFCDLSLHDYIHRETPLESSESIACFIKGASSASSLQIWVVMSQIAAGVEYIHRKGHVHRDIKPANGDSSLFMTDLISSILAQRWLVETGRFWANCRRLVKNESSHSICEGNSRL